MSELMHNRVPAGCRQLDFFLIYRTLLILLAAILAACDSTPKVEVLSGSTMGTTFSVALYESRNRPSLEELQSNVDKILGDIDLIASTYRNDSELARFNGNMTTDWQSASPEFCRMVERSLGISVETEGAFDITVGPLVELWGFGAAVRQDNIPSSEEVAEAMRLVGHNGIETDCARPAIRKRNGQSRLDLSAWAKGHAADRIAAYLNSVELSDYLVEVGGELQMKGNRSGKDPFRIALQHAVSAEEFANDTFLMTNTGVATSGDYHNYYEVDGERYSHTIDPRSGRPVTHTLSTVSVISSSAADADALATALLVMGPERGYEYAVQHEIAAYMTEYSGDGVKTRETPTFSRLVQPAR